MVYAQEHLLIRFNGHFGSSASDFVDRWSSGIRFGLVSSAPIYDPAKLQTFVNACQAAANTFHANTSSFVGTGCYHDFVSGAQIGVLGRYSPAGQLTVVSPTVATNGAGTGGPMPWNTALVISLRTAVPRGVTSNGRVYWPALAPIVSASDGRISAVNVNARVLNFKTFLDACNTAANAYSPGCRALVVSNKGGGSSAAVTSIRSDGRLDTIERRENAKASIWSTQTLA